MVSGNRDHLRGPGITDVSAHEGELRELDRCDLVHVLSSFLLFDFTEIVQDSLQRVLKHVNLLVAEPPATNLKIFSHPSVP